MRYTIYASDRDQVEKRLSQIGKKAVKYGVPFRFCFGENHPQAIEVREYDTANHCMVVVASYTVEAVDVEIETEGFIRQSGWTVLAKIEHGDEGNIVTPLGDAEVDNAWYSAAPKCDHCGTDRLRTVTFMVRHEDGRIRQVGKSCLKDYTGINPALCALWASVERCFDQGMDCDVASWGERSGSQMFSVANILALAIDEIGKNGYRKSDERKSTRDVVIDALKEQKHASAEALAKAEKIVAWLIERGQKAREDDKAMHELRERAWDENEYGEPIVIDHDAHDKYLAIRNAWDSVSDIERNCVPLARGGWANMKYVGRLAYIPVAYDRYWEKKSEMEKREAAHAAEVAASGFVGQVGERLTLKAASAKLISSWETMYGTTFLYRFVDESGNVFVWKASGAYNVFDGVTIKGTVKDHSEYQGVKQTVLTRCKIA